jgi:hypothetical protein
MGYYDSIICEATGEIVKYYTQYEGDKDQKVLSFNFMDEIWMFRYFSTRNNPDRLLMKACDGIYHGRINNNIELQNFVDDIQVKNAK